MSHDTYLRVSFKTPGSYLVVSNNNHYHELMIDVRDAGDVLAQWRPHLGHNMELWIYTRSEAESAAILEHFQPQESSLFHIVVDSLKWYESIHLSGNRDALLAGLATMPLPMIEDNVAKVELRDSLKFDLLSIPNVFEYTSLFSARQQGA